MAESANLAFYAIVASKKLVEKQQLQGALNKATLDGVPLETVLLESGAIKASECVDALALRARLGRKCSSCEGTTYLLPDQNDEQEMCEFCGSALTAKKKRRVARSEEAAVRRAPSARGGRRSTASRRVERARAAAKAAGAEAAPAPPTRRRSSAPAVDEVGLAELVAKAVESCLAEYDLEGLVQRAAQEAVAAAGGGGGGGGDAVEDVAGKALALVQARVENADLSGLFDKVTATATERTLEVVEEQARTAVAAAGGGGGAAPDLSGIEARLNAMQDQLAAASAAPTTTGGPDSGLESAVRALEDRLAQLDGSGGPEGSLAEAVEDLQESLEDLQQQLKPLAGADLRLDTLETQLEEGDGGGGGDSAAVAALQAQFDALDLANLEGRITEAVERKTNARMDADLRGLPDRIGQEAKGPILAAIEERLEKLDLKSLPQRVAEQASAEVLAMVKSQAAEEAQRAVAAASSAGNGGVDRAQILEAVEMRLAKNPPPEEIARMAAGQALAALEERLAGLGGGAPPEEIVQMAVGQAIAAFEERIAQMGSGALGGGGGGVDEGSVRRIALEIVQENAKLSSLDGIDSDPTATAILKRAQQAGATKYDHKKFVGLARELKKLKDAVKAGAGAGGGAGGRGGEDKADKAELRSLAVQVSQLEAAVERLQGAPVKPGASSGGGGGDIKEILASTEFKAAFDTKINQVLGYIKSDVVPKAVKKAMGG